MRKSAMITECWSPHRDMFFSICLVFVYKWSFESLFFITDTYLDSNKSKTFLSYMWSGIYTTCRV